MYRFHPPGGVRVQIFTGPPPDFLVAGADIEDFIFGGIGHPKHLGDTLRQLAETLFAQTQIFLRLLMFPTCGGFAHTQLDTGYQSLQLTFHDEIMGAGLHGRYRQIFADGAGYDDEGQVDPVFLQQGQCDRRTETGHGIVGKDDVPSALGQCGRHRLGGLYLGVNGIITAAPQLAQQQFRVVLRIFQQQYAEPDRHVLLLSPCFVPRIGILFAIAVWRTELKPDFVTAVLIIVFDLVNGFYLGSLTAVRGAGRHR